jgi:uncharacterized membrane protein YkoI
MKDTITKTLAGRRGAGRARARRLRRRRRGDEETGTATAPAATTAEDGTGTAGDEQRGTETALTGDTAAKVKAAALAKTGGGTVDRVETDADGNAAYEAHVTKADGTEVTVYVNEQFAVVGTESGRGGHHGGGDGDHGGHGAETALTGDTASKVQAAALASTGGGTVDRVETDAEGHAAYEAHVTKTDGTKVTVYVNEQFEVVSTDTAGAGQQP